MKKAKKVSHDDLVQEGSKQKWPTFECVERDAIAARGGHCISCPNLEKLFAIRPTSIHGPLRPDNLSVRVRCKKDTEKKYPFQKMTVSWESCPAVRRSQHRQKQISE